MVLKLFKHDVKESAKKMIPVYVITTVTALLLIVVLRSIIDTRVNEFGVFVAFVVAFGLSIGAVVLFLLGLIELLYTSLYNQRGYLLFSLPVKPWEIVVSKILTMTLWSVLLSILLFVLSQITIFTFSGEVYKYIASLFKYVLSMADLRFYAFSFLTWVADNIFVILLFLFLGSFVNSAYVQNHRNIKMFLLYLISNSIFGYVFNRASGGALAAENLVSLNVNEMVFENPGFFENYNPLVDGWERLFSITIHPEHMKVFLLVALLKVLVAGIFFMGLKYFWENKLEIIE